MNHRYPSSANFLSRYGRAAVATLAGSALLGGFVETSPAQANPNPLVVVVPGGPLLVGEGGNPDSVQPVVKRLKDNGYDARAGNYYPKPAGQIHLNGWIRNAEIAVQKARRTRKVACVGESTGAWLCEALAARGEVDAAVAFAGPTKLDDEFSIFTNAYWASQGVSWQERQQASPYYRVQTSSVKAAPTLMLQGTADQLVPLSQGLKYWQVAKDRTVTTYDPRAKRCVPDITLLPMAGVGHAFPDSYQKASIFWLNQHLRPSPALRAAQNACT